MWQQEEYPFTLYRISARAIRLKIGLRLRHSLPSKIEVPMFREDYSKLRRAGQARLHMVGTLDEYMAMDWAFLLAA